MSFFFIFKLKIFFLQIYYFCLGLDRLFLIWPLTIEHYIDINSPFWNISSHDLKNERFEIAVILEGIVER
jgi:hypothetical protein